MDEPVRLAVDLGTTHTVAVVRRGGQQPRALLFDGTPLLSSGVFVDAAGTPHTGRDAQRLGAAEPHRFEPHPKRRVDEGSVLLGEHEVPVEQLLAASLRRVADEAQVAGVSPAGATVLTCPADWGQPRRTVLRAAAWRAGLGQVRLLDEPIAAATYCLQVLGQQVAPGQCLGVFDFGGGTFDVAVVRREPAGLRVLATGGLDDLGGLDVDSALVAHLGQLVAVRDPQLWQRLDQPGESGQRRDRQAFWTEVRAAKEMLSRSSSAPVHVPGRAEPMHLTRDELERVAGPLVARAVDETRRVLQRAGVEPAALAGLLLVGGASRMPLVASRLHARLGVAPAVPEQPELPVAYGALVHAMTPSVTQTPAVPSYPVSGPFGPPAEAPVPPPRALPRPRRRGRRLLLIVLVGALVGGLTAAVVSGVRWLAREVPGWNAGSLGGPGGGDGELATVHTVALSRPGAAGVAVAGDRVVYAVAGGGVTEVVALPGAGGAPQWTVRVPIEPTDIRLTAVGDLIVLDGERSATDGGEDVRAVLGAADGKLRWRKVWPNRTDVAYFGTDAVVEVRDVFTANAVLRVDLRTGRERWKRTAGDESLNLDSHRIEAVRQWPGEKGGTVPAVAGTLADVFTAATDAVVELNADVGRGVLVNAATGKAKASGALPLQDETWTVHGGLVIGVQSEEVAKGRAVLAAYRLPSFAPAWTLPLTAGFGIERVKPCGQHLVCMAVDEPEDDKTVAVDVRTGKQSWSAAVEWHEEESWYVGAGGLVFGEATFDTVQDARILKADGTQAARLPAGSSVEAVQGGRMVVSVVNQVYVGEVGSGKATVAVEVGAEPPEQVALAGDLVGVITSDRKVLALRVQSLA